VATGCIAGEIRTDPVQSHRSLSQGTSAHSCVVEVERYEGPLPDVKAFRQPPMTTADQP
jgi:hypothetical protein